MLMLLLEYLNMHSICCEIFNQFRERKTLKIMNSLSLLFWYDAVVPLTTSATSNLFLYFNKRKRKKNGG